MINEEVIEGLKHLYRNYFNACVPIIIAIVIVIAAALHYEDKSVDLRKEAIQKAQDASLQTIRDTTSSS